MQVPFTVVAILWAWMAIAYHLLFFTDINPMAYLFAADTSSGSDIRRSPLSLS